MNQLPLFAAGDKPARAPRPTEPIIRSAEIELPYRWLMRRAWGASPTILSQPKDLIAWRRTFESEER